MKMCRLWVVLMMTAVTLLTSCLGDSDNTVTQTLPGVFRYHNGRTVVETIMGKLYSPELETKYIGYSEGDCCIINFEYNSSAPENENEAANGYSYVSNIAIGAVPAGDVSFTTDTATMLPKEIALLEGGYNMAYYGYFAYLSGSMILTSTYNQLTDQKTRFELFFDPAQTPTPATDQYGKGYSIYLRATVVSDGKTPSTEVMVPYGYNIKYFIDTIYAREQGNEIFHLKLYYVSKINSDNTLVWSAEDVIIPFEVEKK